jgi:RNA polymerase sigma-70 factor (ECF subfamily)
MTEFPESDEITLMRRIRARDEAALGELYDRYSRFVYSLTARILTHDLKLAEEATQDTFLKVWRQAELWDSSKGRLATWLLTIARRTAIDTLRKERRRPTSGSLALDDLSEVLGDQSIVDDPAWQDGRLLQKFMHQLPVEQMQVIELAYYFGMSHSQIADHLDVPLGTVKTRIQLGLQKLRDQWVKSGSGGYP